MRHLINREDYIKEYLRISNIENENELYEGLLSTVFGGLKMLFKKDWENIKCKNPSVLDHLKEIDKSLSGYTMAKMEFSNECNNIRQNIADYYNDILEYKLLQLEKEENAEKFLEKEKMDSESDGNDEKNEDRVDSVGKILNIKDKTLMDSLKKYVENIKTNTSKSPKLKEYADQMLNAVIITVNDIILEELEKKGLDKARIEEERKELEEEKKRLEEERKKMAEEAKKESEKKLKKLSKDRDDAIRKLGVNPIGPMDGNKAIEDITKQFSGMIDEFNKINNSSELSNVFKSDTYIGVKNDIESLNLNFNGDEGIKNAFLIKVILNKVNTVFGVVNEDDIKKLFDNTPSTSVQSMMISLTNAVIYGFVGDKFNIETDKIRKQMMVRCIIDSDATIGFNLPFIDSTKPENGNLFIDIMNKFKNDTISSDEFKNVLDLKYEKNNSLIKNKDKKKITDEFGEDGSKLIKEFRQNISKLFDILLKEAKKIKDKAERDREAEAEKLN
jgi:hypothetical protein